MFLWYPDTINNVEVYLSDNFSAVFNHTYHLILSNPAQHLGNTFLEELVKESYNHLKKGGELVWVIQKHVTPFAQRLFKSHFGNCKVLVQTKDYGVIKGYKQ